MKHFMMPRSQILRENHHETASNAPQSSSPNLKSKPGTPNTSSRKHKSSSKENAQPINSDLNVTSSPSSASVKLKSPLPPRPPLKRKLSVESAAAAALENGVVPVNSPDSGVKVIVRVRPPNKDEDEGPHVVQKIADDSLSIAGQTFTFDSIADIESNQARNMDIFQLVGAPLVENCLAGFNSSVFAYGQTGSGKTYTIWGASNALLEEDQQGLAPRVFHRLFERIDEEQIKQADRKLVFMCRCSFLEIYNEQITDLLDPSQKNLQIREDVNSGVYVENLTEECVSSMKNVSQLLIKGLSNRRTGSTSVNAESSRSHSVFTCVVESRSKSAADGLSHVKVSRINFVDLAGSERQKQTGAAGERLKEAGNINRSLSQLGNLINILAEVSQTGKHRHIPYRDSKLTFLLQESLGGNAKLAMICAVSPSQSCKSETFSTLRFAQRAKAIKNKAIVNEEMQDDVNVLREVIRQLKDELHRIKTNGNQTGPNGAYATGWNARRSLNLLKFSLNRPLTLPHLDDDGDAEMEIVMETEETGGENKSLDPPEIECPCSQPGVSKNSSVQEARSEIKNTCSGKQGYEDLDVDMEDEAFEAVEENKTNLDIHGQNTPEKSINCVEDGVTSIPSTTPVDVLPILKSPVPSVSPRLNCSRKSLRTSSNATASQSVTRQSKSLSKPSNSFCSKSISSRKSYFASNDQLASTLQQGIKIIESQCLSSALRRSSFRFSCIPVEAIPVVKVDAGVQTMFMTDDESLENDMRELLCHACKTRNLHQGLLSDEDNGQNMQLVPATGSSSHHKLKNHVPKAVEKVLAGAIRREMALEEICSKQATEVMQLNRLIQQYKHERECNAIIGRTREDKIARLESLMDGVMPTEEFMEDELLSLTHEHKACILQQQYDNHPDVLRAKIELKRAHDELERYQNFFDLGERDVLLEEIQDLRTQLQFYLDSPQPKASKRQNRLMQLTYSLDSKVAPALWTIPESTENAEKFQMERVQWTEAESKWISFVEELRLELEANRSLAQKQNDELKMEKKCSEELKEAMQMAMEGHARMLEQYAELEEKHIQLLARHRRIQDGIDDVKKAASKAGVRGAESKFINALAAEISALKVEREKERRYFRDENRGLQEQLRDTAEAVQAAGELLVRLKEADEAVTAAEKRALMAEQETEMAYREIDKLNKLLAAPHMTEEEFVAAKSRETESDKQWQEEFAPSYDVEEEPPSWFSGYDRCNI
ncbi:Phragmoplast-associated kinesin-related protein isoform 1 [Dorcoceras hygrometricum]|uniref:Phragmoplast-associated kinesin-related protein isoform 1 n=1 Tax=Dorcoceras hygrometricum TaxID=472368 RepID=A0A2Z7AWU7_9LAMI|nr:Phragmoplast-associated kinesin-related protein isoform 1 [Dorcoceras hygrometricum]